MINKAFLTTMEINQMISLNNKNNLELLQKYKFTDYISKEDNE
jgi:hypothetical protein